MPIAKLTNAFSFKHFALIGFFLLAFLSASAQDSLSAEKRWKIILEPYLMFANLKGTVGAGTLPDAKVDADFGEIFSHLKMAAMLYGEVSNNKWAFTSDLIYMKLVQDASPSTLINSGEVTLKQFVWELAALRKLLPWLEAGIGGRLNSLDTEVDLVTNNIGGGTTARNKGIKQSWFDPIIIARVKSNAVKKFIYQFRGDFGGFGVGSDFTWQIQAYAGYRFSKLFQITAGYRFIGIDYNKGSGEERFLYDVDTFGPVIRFGFNF